MASNIGYSNELGQNGKDDSDASQPLAWSFSFDRILEVRVLRMVVRRIEQDEERVLRALTLRHRGFFLSRHLG